MESLDGVAVEDGDRGLEQDRAGIDLLGDEVDGAARHLYAGPERLLDSVHAAAERGQKRRVDVQDPPLEGAHETRGEDAVVPRVDDQLDTLCLQPVAHGRVSGLARGE